MNRQATDGEISALHISDTRFVSRIYTKLLQINLKKVSNPTKKWVRLGDT